MPGKSNRILAALSDAAIRLRSRIWLVSTVSLVIIALAIFAVKKVSESILNVVGVK